MGKSLLEPIVLVLKKTWLRGLVLLVTVVTTLSLELALDMPDSSLSIVVEPTISWVDQAQSNSVISMLQGSSYQSFFYVEGSNRSTGSSNNSVTSAVICSCSFT